MADNDWSPADHPYSIAGSEAQWWSSNALLSILRMRGLDDRRIGMSSRQIDARTLIIALRQLLDAAALELDAVRDLGLEEAAAQLADARDQYLTELPGAKEMRDGLIHFREWSRGTGRGPQEKMRDSRQQRRDVARHFWTFGYDPTTETVTLGPYSIELGHAEHAVQSLTTAIHTAAREVDRHGTAELRAATLHALSVLGEPIDFPASRVKVSFGFDQRIYVALRANLDDTTRLELAGRIPPALAVSALRLLSADHSEEADPAVRLAQGEAMIVVRDVRAQDSTAE